MIHEYALEPELVASWHDRMHFRFFIEKFGFGTGRVVSRYPKKWRRLVWEALRATYGTAVGEVERKRVEELLARLTTPEIRRLGCVWDDAHAWLENAEQENERRPFHAILSRDNPRRQPNVVLACDILAGSPEAWRAPSSIVVERTAASMAHAVAPMLRSAKRILLVDPHFRASRQRYQNSLGKFLRLVRVEAPQVAIELYAGNVADNAPDWDFFRGECERYVPDLVPAGLTLVVRRWTNRAEGEKLHNRYILTDIGGVQFGVGLDEGDPGTTDDVMRLDIDVYRRRIEDYAGAAPVFNLEGEIQILGTLAT